MQELPHATVSILIEENSMGKPIFTLHVTIVALAVLLLTVCGNVFADQSTADAVADALKAGNKLLLKKRHRRVAAAEAEQADLQKTQKKLQCDHLRFLLRASSVRTIPSTIQQRIM